MPGIPLGLNMGLIFSNLRNSVSSKTWSDYKLSWSRWFSFCQNVGSDPFSVTPLLALSFLSNLIQARLSPASVSKILAGVSFFLKFSGLPALTSFFQVTQVLKGFRRSRPSSDGRRPISVELLLDLLGSLHEVCSSGFEVLLFKAVFSVAFFGALRVGEFTAINKSSSSFLRFNHIRVQDGCLFIFLCRSKSMPVGKGCWFSLSSSPNDSLCPVSQVERYLAVRPTHPDSFFVHSDLSPLTRYQFSAVFLLV